MSAPQQAIAKGTFAICFAFLGLNAALLLAALIDGRTWQATISAFALGAVSVHLYHLREKNKKS